MISAILSLALAGTPTGGCCIRGSCYDAWTAADCAAKDRGVYLGDRVTCTSSSCDGACCVGGSTCAVASMDRCERKGGTYAGDTTTCSGRSCDVPTGACCIRGSDCIEMTADNCRLKGLRYRGDGTLCKRVACAEKASTRPDDAVAAGLPPVTDATQPADYIDDDLPPDDAERPGCRGSVRWSARWSNYAFHRVTIDAAQDITVTGNFSYAIVTVTGAGVVTCKDCNLVGATVPAGLVVVGGNTYTMTRAR